MALVGCLGRTLPEDELSAQGSTDSSTVPDGALDDVPIVDDVTVLDSSIVEDTSTTPDVKPPPPDSIDFFDIFPIPDSGPIGECATCVATNCSKQVNKCLNDPACLKGMTCVLTTCLTGGGGGAGGFDFACVTGCFGGDFSTAAEAISAFTCITGSCGSKCAGALGGGIPGLPGTDAGARDGGGRDGGGRDGGGRDGASGEAGGAAARIDEHPWTAADVESTDPTTRIEFSPDAFDAWKAQIHSAACAEHYAVCSE